ncbi:aladin [Tetranychus urticae]|uniref:Aladin seven-bladed propeller domain-containing protein n=1 Tax=Tetranychus urticae TaxID=32264 RepID=T1KR58_TETUR|nr:aladin [Tetranychus urticae]
MAEFDKFPLIEAGSTRRTVREYDGRLEEGTSDPAIINNQGVEYPLIDIDKKPIIKPVKSSFRAKDYFVEEPAGDWKKCYQLWTEDGTLSALNFITSLPSVEPILPNIGRTIAKTFAYAVLYLCKLFLQIYLYFFPYAKHSPDALCDEFCRYFGPRDLFICFAWHPKKMVCSIGLANNDIYIYSSLRKTALLIKHPHQKKLSDLAWKPGTTNVLAVACQNCILIWDLDQVELKKMQLSNCVQLFKDGLPNGITSIAYDSTGEMLAACSPQSTKLFIIKKGPEGNDEFQIVRNFPTCFTRLLWSPDSLRLLTLTTSNYVSIFESIAWSCKKWSLENRTPIQCACWSQPEGTFLLFANKKEPIVYALAFYDQATANDVGGYVKHCQEVLNVSETILPNGIKVGGRIHDMVWDSNGQRLVISFVDNPEYLAVYRTWSKSLLELSPIGFIHGLSGEKPILISFHDYFKHGSLLTVCWSSGIVSNIPLYYDNNKTNQSVIKNGTPRRLTSFCLSTPISGKSSLNSPALSFSIASPRETSLFTQLQSSPRPHKISI